MPNREAHDMTKMPQNRGDLMATLAHHDAQIGALGGRMSGVENQMRTLQGEVHTGFAALGSKLDKIDAAPKFDFHRTVSTVTTIAVLFGMIVSGIVYITTGQFSGAWSKQESLNASLQKRVDLIEEKTEKLLGWAPVVEPSRKR